MISKVLGHVIFFSIQLEPGIRDDVDNSPTDCTQAQRVGFIIWKNKVNNPQMVEQSSTSDSWYLSTTFAGEIQADSG